METVTYRTHWARSSAWAKGLAVATLVAGSWALSAGAAHARGGNGDVYWSIGVNSPGVSVGVSNAPPVVVHQRPVYVQPHPVVIHQPYPYVRPVVVVPRPVYYQGWGHGPGWDDRHDRRHGHGHGHWRDRGHDRHDNRWDDDDRRGGDRRGDGRR